MMKCWNVGMLEEEDTPVTNSKPLNMSFFDKYLTVWVSLCMIVGVLVEVPVMLSLVKIANNTKSWFPVAT